MSETKNKFKQLLPYFFLAFAIIAVYRVSGELEFFSNFFGRVWSIISPFFYGFMLAYIINIPISGIQKLINKSKNKLMIKRQRMFSVIAVFAILAGLIALALAFIVPAIERSVEFFRENAESYWQGVLRVIDDFNNLGLFGIYIDDEFIFGILGNFLSGFTTENLAQLINEIIGVGEAIFAIIIAFISSIYILIEKDKFKGYIVKLLGVFASPAVNKAIMKNVGTLNNNFRQYIKTQTLDGLILGTMATILLAILGSPYAILLGLMLGIVNYIPYFGSIFGTIVAVLVVGFTQDITMGLIAAVSLLVIQQIDANIIQPRLMSGSFSLSPLLVIISITVGGAIAGIFGMIVAIPIVAVLKDIFEGIVAYYQHKKEAKI